MISRVYRFGNYELDPGTRELRRDGTLLPLPRRVFDGLAHLVEHRDRAVGHDELIANLWGRVDIANAQVSQLIMQVRRAVSDDSSAQQLVRTVSGFGYRWIAVTEETASVAVNAPDAAQSAAKPLPAVAGEVDARHAPTTKVPAHARSLPTTVPATTSRRRGATWLFVFCLLLAAALISIAALRRHATAPSLTAHDQAIVVLPLDVNAPEDTDAAWIRLGVMDLVAGRLRQAGLPVPPSDSVVAALHAAAALPESERLAALKRTLDAGTLVQGTATRSATGWTIELTAVSSDDARRRVESVQVEIMDTARQATDLLLAALGRSASADAREDQGLGEYLQRARAAMLANELETTRSILAGVPEALRDAPELRCELARVEYHAGRVDQARAITSRLLDDPAVIAEPHLHAKALRMRGWIATMGESEDWTAAERYFSAAVDALRDAHASAELGKVLAERGVARVFLHRFDEAVLDLGQARSQLEIAGDRQGLGEMSNYLGQLAFARNRVAEAVRYFNAAATIAESFGAIDALRYNLTASLAAQMRLLHWPDALAIGERLQALRARIENPGLQASIDGYHADVLVALGRQREADAMLTGAENSHADIPPSLTRFRLQARAELAWQRGRTDQAFAAATQALAVWPRKSSADAGQHASIALLRQRASIVNGQPLAADIGALEPAADSSLAAYRLVAEAEWAAHQADAADAGRLFHAAAASAEAQGVPDVIALTAQAQGYWLINRGEIAQASALAGRIAIWAEHDFDSALLQVAVFHAAGQVDAWARALKQAQSLAGEREIPRQLLTPPTQH